jgi:A/G-specific adenine glycosylase
MDNQIGRNFPTEDFLTWFRAKKRDLPWRKEPSFYEVLVSEFMLQQTVVQTVIPYYHAWMRQFPNLQALASAHIDEVIKAWEGLGYYSRARRLHAIACELTQKPIHSFMTYDSLIELKGIGDYTAKAILAFAFQKPEIAIDGNVLRVGARFLGIHENIKLPQVKRKIQKFFDSIDKSDGQMAEGLIELGATICKKIPKCDECPIADYCCARQNKITDQIPVVDKRKAIEKISTHVAVIQSGYFILVQKRSSSLMAGLYEFPSLEKANLSQAIILNTSRMPQVSRSYTHYKETIDVTFLEIQEPISALEGEWIEYKKLEDLPFSGGHRKIRKMLLEKLINENCTH